MNTYAKEFTEDCRAVVIITLQIWRASVETLAHIRMEAPAARYKNRVREAVHFSSVGDRSGRRVVPRAAAPRNRAHSPRPRNVHSFSRLVRKHGGQRRRADASLRGLSELLQQDRQQAAWWVSVLSVVSCPSGYLRRAWPVWKVKRDGRLSLSLSLLRFLSVSRFVPSPFLVSSVLIRCAVLYLKHVSRLRSVDYIRDRAVSKSAASYRRRRRPFRLARSVLIPLVSALDSAAPSMGTSAREQRLLCPRVHRVLVVFSVDIVIFSRIDGKLQPPCVLALQRRALT